MKSAPTLPPEGKLLLICRHAKSSWQDHVLGDVDRPLNKRGQRDAPEMGRRLHQRGLRPDLEADRHREQQGADDEEDEDRGAEQEPPQEGSQREVGGRTGRRRDPGVGHRVETRLPARVHRHS